MSKRTSTLVSSLRNRHLTSPQLVASLNRTRKTPVSTSTVAGLLGRVPLSSVCVLLPILIFYWPVWDMDFSLQLCLEGQHPEVASPQSCLGDLQTIPSTSWLGFCSDVHCQMWDHIDRCAFPNHVQSIESTTGGPQSSCRNIKDDQCKQDAPELNWFS